MPTRRARFTLSFTVDFGRDVLIDDTQTEMRCAALAGAVLRELGQAALGGSGTLYVEPGAELVVDALGALGKGVPS